MNVHVCVCTCESEQQEKKTTKKKNKEQEQGEEAGLQYTYWSGQRINFTVKNMSIMWSQNINQSGIVAVNLQFIS